MAEKETGSVNEKVAGAKSTTSETPGKELEDSGRKMKEAGQKTENVGKGIEKFGNGTSQVGKKMLSAGSELTSTGIGAPIGLPLAGIGAATTLGGKGIDIAGKGVKAAGKGIKTTGKGMEKTGNTIGKVEPDTDEEKHNESGMNSNSGLRGMAANLLGNKNSKLGVLVGKSPLKKYLILGIVAVCAFIIVIVVITTVIFGPIMMAQQYIEDVKNEVSLFFEKVGNVITLNGWCADSDGSCQRKAEQKYYEQLDEVYKDYKDDGIEIDTQLITGTMFYGNTLSDDKFEGEDVGGESDGELVDASDIHLGDVKTLAKNMLSGGRLDYAKYRKYLVETYIPKRFGDMYSGEKEKEDIADEIMSFASKSIDIEDNTGRSYISNLCPEICTTSGNCYDLETYVAGVVAGESGMFKNFTPNYKEQWKAQAVAARTYALNRTDWCKNPIDTTTNAQVLNINSPLLQEIKEAVSETQGQVITYEGEIFSTEYDSFYLNNNYHCSSDECYATYVKKGPTEALSKESHEIASYAKWKNGFAGGHGRGMSQYGAAYLADKGWTYDQILSYYYIDNIQLSFIGGTFTSGEFVDGLLFPLAVNSKTGNCVSAGNYYSGGSFHGAVDIAGVNMGYSKPYEEIPVIASIGGKVTVMTTNQWCSNTQYYNDDTRLPRVTGCIGNNVTILVTDKNSKWYNYQFIYYHLDSVNPDLKIGDEVPTGEFLGYMGSTGNSTGFHLHYDIRNPDGSHLNDKPVGDYVTGLISTYCSNNRGS